MATTQDEVKIRIGVDHRAVGPGMSSVRSEIKKGTAAISDQIGSDSVIINGAIAKSFKSTFKALTGLLAVNLISMGYQLLGWWNNVTKQIAENFYNVGVTKIIGNALERDRQYWRNQVKERDKAVADAAKKLVEEQRKAAELSAKISEAADASFATFSAREGENSEKVRRHQRQNLEYRLAITEGQLREAKIADDQLKIAQAEVDVQKAKLALIQFENKLRDEAAAKRAREIAAENAINMAKREKITGILGTGAFSGELREVARLRADAALAQRAGNIAWAQTDMAIAGQILRGIQQRIAPQINIPGKPEDALKNQLLDALAPIKNPDGSIKVWVNNVE